MVTFFLRFAWMNSDVISLEAINSLGSNIFFLPFFCDELNDNPEYKSICFLKSSVKYHVMTI